MRKTVIICCMAISILLISGCNKKQQGGDIGQLLTPTPAETAQQAPNTEEPENKLTVRDYYPMQADVEYVYTGEGNEFAASNRFVDYISDDSSRIQVRTNNGGTETVRVIEAKDGKLTIIKTVHECYYRDNLLAGEPDEKKEILLMEPLVKGTNWTLADGRKRYISETDVEVTTPHGKYRALEVTTEAEESITKDYYVAGLGPVKTIFNSSGYEVITELSELKKNSPYIMNIDIFYPGVDSNIYVQPVTLSFKTGDITRIILQEKLSKNVNDDLLVLASSNTRINSMYLGDDGIAYIDFSAELVTEMNVGAGYEGLILQAITNTVGNYYGTDEVYITVDGKPYESGHLLMMEGETFQVDMSRVIR